VGKVDDDVDAMLAKYDRSDAPTSERAGKKTAKPEDADRSLFLQYVGDMKPEDADGS
jgi:hypothetical protein